MSASISRRKAEEISMAIAQNERKPTSTLTDQQIAMYLVDKGVEETPANIRLVRNA